MVGNLLNWLNEDQVRERRRATCLPLNSTAVSPVCIFSLSGFSELAVLGFCCLFILKVFYGLSFFFFFVTLLKMGPKKAAVEMSTSPSTGAEKEVKEDQTPGLCLFIIDPFTWTRLSYVLSQIVISHVT